MADRTGSVAKSHPSFDPPLTLPRLLPHRCQRRADPWLGVEVKAPNSFALSLGRRSNGDIVRRVFMFVVGCPSRAVGAERVGVSISYFRQVPPSACLLPVGILKYFRQSTARAETSPLPGIAGNHFQQSVHRAPLAVRRARFRPLTGLVGKAFEARSTRNAGNGCQLLPRQEPAAATMATSHHFGQGVGD